MKKILASVLMCSILPAFGLSGKFLNPGDNFKYNLSPVDTQQTQEFKCYFQKFRTDARKNGELKVSYEEFVPSPTSISPGVHYLRNRDYIGYIKGLVTTDQSSVVFSNVSQNATGLWIECHNITRSK